jgi:hypothetical protein
MIPLRVGKENFRYLQLNPIEYRVMVETGHRRDQLLGWSSRTQVQQDSKSELLSNGYI